MTGEWERHDEEPTAESSHPTGLEFFYAGNGYDQWADDRLRLQRLMLGEPSLDDALDVRMEAFRLSLTWLH